VDSPDIVPAANYSIDHEHQSPPYFIPDYGKGIRIGQYIQELDSVKTQLPDGSSQDIFQPLLGVSDCDHSFPVEQNLGFKEPLISVDNLGSSTGCHVAIVDEANGSYRMLLAQQDTLDIHAWSFPDYTDISNFSSHEKHRQIDRSFHTGISFNNGLIPSAFHPPLNSTSTHMRSVQEGQIPVIDSFGNTCPSNEFVLPSTNFLCTRFNSSNESPFLASDFSSSGVGILPTESAEYQYDFPTCPLRPVPDASLKWSIYSSVSSARGSSEEPIPLLSYSPISSTSDQATVSIKLRKTQFQFKLTKRL
jgi:hypothetical protein